MGEPCITRAMSEIRAVVFDAYGTLLDVHAAMARHAGPLGARWPLISADWRQKQLEYSWIRSLAGPVYHRDFWTLTQDALTWAAARHGNTDPAVRDAVLAAYRTLDPYPEAPDVLRHLRARGLPLAILSNGSPDMLADATRAAGIDTLLDHVLSIEAAGIYKPDPRVYRLAETALGFPAGQMAFVSSNPWDAFGAAAFGFRVFWVNRSGAPPEYGLAETATLCDGLRAVQAALS